MMRIRQVFAAFALSGITAGAGVLGLSGCDRASSPSEAPAASDDDGAKSHDDGEVADDGEAADDGLLLSGKHTYALIVGVLEFSEPGVAGWSAEKRKDEELYRALLARGVPKKNMRFIADEKATHAHVLRSLREIAGRTGKGDTLLFYYAGHGTRDAKGRPSFVAYDSVGADMQRTGITLAAVGDILEKHFEGERLLLMADACYSGTLKDVAKRLSKKTHSGSLTSADASNISTNNWTFTQTVLDGLAGDPLMDADEDGTVDLDELTNAVQAAMKYREHQLFGAHYSAISVKTPVGKVKGRRPKQTGELPLGSYALTDNERGKPEVVQIRGGAGDRRDVRFYRYNHAVDRQIDDSALRAISFQRYPNGSALKVFWGGKLYDAKVLRTQGDFHFITYPGWGPEWNEWVLSDRISDRRRHGDTAPEVAVGDAVEVEWRGKWWPAKVLRREGDHVLIHYDGYDDSWDEWVGPERVRKKT